MGLLHTCVCCKPKLDCCKQSGKVCLVNCFSETWAWFHLQMVSEIEFTYLSVFFDNILWSINYIKRIDMKQTRLNGAILFAGN